MYIRIDDTGITVSSSRTEFDKKPVSLMELDDVNIGRGITVSSLYNFRFILIVMLLASVPLVYGINEAFPEGFRADRTMQEVKKRCAKKGVESVIITPLIGDTKTINCGELS
jgi:hypothetical protein